VLKRTWIPVLAICLSVLMCLTACSDKSPSPESPSTSQDPQTATSWWESVEVEGDVDLSDAIAIHLQDNGITAEGDGVTVKQNTVTVTAGGVYVLDGTLSDGQIRVESADAQPVRLVLNGVDIHSKTTAPLFIRSCEKAILTLATGSENRLSDAADAVFEDVENEEPSGTLFSKSDLVINGDGALTVTAAFRDGIVSRDGLTLDGGRVTVDAADDAVMGRDFVLVRGGTYALTAQGDGIKSTNDGGETVGCIAVEGGNVTIDSQKDGIQATSSLTMNGATVTVTAGGGHQNGAANTAFDFGWGRQSTDSESAGKGLKAGTSLTVSGGTISVDAADDAVHSNGTIVMAGGQLTAASGDDGVHADTSVTVQAGTLTVTDSYEALEAATITIDGGDISLTASDDGINASAGTSGSTGDPYGQDPFAADDSLFVINGGTLRVDAGGDGLDSNGTIRMSGGDVYVCGPSNSGNGTFDFGAGFDISGGSLIGVGSLGMAQTPTGNTQNSIVWGGCSLQSGSTLTVTDENGEVVMTLESARTAQWAYITSPQLDEGHSYTLSDGVTSETITLTSGLNTIGTASGGMMGGPGMGGPGMGRPDMGGRPDASPGGTRY